MSEVKTDNERKGKRELFEADITKAMKDLASANNRITKALGRLPKIKPKIIPEGCSLSTSYPNWALQDILKDLHNSTDGVLDGGLQVLADLQKLAQGEVGFEL